MKSQKITQEVRKAIRQWYDESGLSQPEIGDLVDLSNQSVNQWLNGRSNTIRPSNWLKLYPYIKQYLPPEFPPPQDDASPPSSSSTPSIPLPRADHFLQIILEAWPDLTLEERSELATKAALYQEEKKSNESITTA